MPELDGPRLRAFVAVARERGFSRAARKLGRTQSAVSEAVAQLEAELGQRLFVRQGRVTLPTAAGRVLLEHAERVYEELARARTRIQAEAELRAGELAIGTSDTLACHLLPPVLAAFRARYPAIELRLDNRPSPATAREVAERRLDLGVVSLPLPGAPERLRVEPLCPHEDVLICPPGHALARRRRVPVAALAEHPLLLLDRNTAGRAVLEAAFARLPRRPRVTMEMSSVEVLKRLVELGFGLSVVPALAVAGEVKAGTLAGVRLRGLGAARRVGLVLPAPGPASRAAEAFADVARAALGRVTGRS